MSATIEKRTRKSLLRSLVSDPYRKLAAIGLACALYYYLDKQVNETTTFELTMVPIDEAAPAAVSKGGNDLPDTLQVIVPTGKVTVKAFRDAGNGTITPHVTLSLFGPKGSIENLKLRSQPFSVGPFPNVDWTRSSGFDFTVADIVRDAQLKDLKLVLDPPRVHLDLEPTWERQVTLSLDNVALEWQNKTDSARLTERLRREAAVFSKTSIRLRGPRGQVQALTNNRYVFRADLRSKDDDLKVEGLVELPPEAAAMQHISMDEGVTVTIPVRPEPKTFALDIPLLIDDRSLPPSLRGRYWPQLDNVNHVDPLPNATRPELFLSLTVEVNVSGLLLAFMNQYNTADLADWARQHFLLRFWIPPDQASSEPAQLPPLQASLELRAQGHFDPIHYSLKNAVALTLVLHDQ